MENASKALIIAGAILISILLISLGIMIYNQAGDVINTGAMDEFAITQFNQKFTQYEGKKSGSQVKSLIQQVISSNANEENEDKQITVSVTDGSSEVIKVEGTKYSKGNASLLKSTSKYNIVMKLSEDETKKGLVETIEVTKAGSSSSGGGPGGGGGD